MRRPGPEIKPRGNGRTQDSGLRTQDWQWFLNLFPRSAWECRPGRSASSAPLKSTTAGRPDHLAVTPPRLVEPEVVREVGRELGITRREPVPGPLTTLHVLQVQARHGDTAPPDPRLKPDVPATAGAICRARPRLLLAFFLAKLGHRWRGATADVGTWLGRRAVFVDGSGCSMPDVGPSRVRYGQPPAMPFGSDFVFGFLVFDARTVRPERQRGLISDHLRFEP